MAQESLDYFMGVRRGFYSRFFAAIYDPFMKKIEEHILSRHRRELLKDLSGTVLEIGAGTGANFPYYLKGDVHGVVVIEPNQYLWEKALKKFPSLREVPMLKVLPAGIEDEAAQKQIPAGKIDAVICTLVLCTIPDPEGFLRKAQEWLRPGGRLILLEHVRSHHRVEGFLQDLFTPAWRILADGCHLNRQTDRLLSNLPMTLREERYFHFTLPFYRAIYEKKPPGNPGAVSAGIESQIRSAPNHPPT